MRKLEVLAPAGVTFKSGTFKLTKDQFANRRYVVKVIDKDALIVEPLPNGEISFKCGEVVETDVEIGKGSTTLKPLDEATSEPVAAPMASAPADAGATSTTAQDGADKSADAQPGAEQSSDDPLAALPDAPPTASRKRR